jgi:very-short-patch-repair endonuclease
LLWRYLNAGHLGGLSFRRQTPIGSYIADVICHGARIIVEIDGWRPAGPRIAVYKRRCVLKL